MKALHRSLANLLLALVLAQPFTCAKAQTNQTKSHWENEVAAFEESDHTNPPPKHEILFLGSSTFRKWTSLTQDFAGLKVINRGFGGSQISDSVELVDRLVFPYEPRIIVFYAGDNDLAAGKSVDRVVADYAAFVKKVHDQLPQTDIDYLSIKPCIARWKLRDKVAEVNSRIQKMSGDHLKFINIAPLMIGDDGLPKKDLFIGDGLHPSEKCYHMWVPVIRPYLE